MSHNPHTQAGYTRVNPVKRNSHMNYLGDENHSDVKNSVQRHESTDSIIQLYNLAKLRNERTSVQLNFSRLYSPFSQPILASLSISKYFYRT